MEASSLGSGGQIIQPSVPVLLDDSSRLRVLHPELYANSRAVEKNSNNFRSKLRQFQTLVKNLLAHVDEQSQKIERAKSQAIGTRNMVSTEVETRSEVLREQKNIIADKQEQLEGQVPENLIQGRRSTTRLQWIKLLAQKERRLNAELKSLVMVKQEQEVLIAHLSESSPPGL